jgi:ectoine hydroxylase-related dioxygenase (phytanoyl-CoA dioxygenase family)
MAGVTSSDPGRELEQRGFVVIPGPLDGSALARVTSAYDMVMSSAAEPDLRVGSTTTRVSGVVNRGEEFDALYVYEPLLDACKDVIGRPFKLSSLVARTLRPHMPAQELHVDVRRDSADWPLVGFILMIDEFTPQNGATRFVAGSHRWTDSPEGGKADLRADRGDQELACGPAGTLLIFNGSAWHGHTANTTDRPRRSLHGSFIPREGKSATDFSASLTPETRARLSPLACELLSLP